MMRTPSLVRQLLVGVGFAAVAPITSAAFGQTPLPSTTVPLVRTELQSKSTIPGQPVRLRVTVLVPTWLPSAPVWPNFDFPNVMVRLPTRATNPVSERVNGETWSGIVRDYQIIPLVPGKTQIPSRPISIIYADPETHKPVTSEQIIQAFDLTGTIPKGAKQLEPFIAARRISIKQKIEGDITGIEPGAAVTRSIRINIEGAPPMVVPPLLTYQVPEGLRAYPEEPSLDETFKEGVFLGSRDERVTYVAENGGRFTLPRVQLRWFNLETNKIETAEIDGLKLSVNGTRPEAVKEPLNPIEMLRKWLPWLIGLMVLLFIVQRYARLLRTRIDQVYANYRASETYAYRKASSAIMKQRLGPAIAATREWWRQISGRTGQLPETVAAEFAGIGSAVYGRQNSEANSRTQMWRAARRALIRSRQQIRIAKLRNRKQHLPDLNP